MSTSAPEWLQRGWDRNYRDESYEARQKAEDEAESYFKAATVPQRLAYREACETAVKLHGHGSMAHEATLRLAKSQWDRDTAAARELMIRSVECLLEYGELTDSLNAEWEALYPPRSEPKLIVVGDHTPEIYRGEAA